MNKEAFSKIGIFLIVIIVMVIIGGVVIWQYAGWRGEEKAKEQREVVTEPKEEPGEEKEETTIEKESKTWDIYQSVLAAIKSRDIEKANSLAYEKINLDDCKKMGMPEEQCWAMIEAFATTIGNLKEADFTKISEDKNQIIMSTEPLTRTDTEGYSISSLYFIKDVNGKILLLRMNKKDEVGLFKDTDGDNLTDEEENCTGVSQYDPKCIKTNPNLKDTDDDGWWDSIEKEAETDPNNKDNYPLF